MRTIRKIVAVGLLTIAALPALAADGSLNVGRSDTTIRITGFVPVICHARVTASMVNATPGTVALGELNEFCNNAAGYRVYADYSPSMANMKLVVAGREVELGESGTVLVSTANHANIDSKSLSLQVGESPQQVGNFISFRIEAL